MSIEKTSENGSYRIEGFRAEHFSLWNTGLLMDLYRDLSDENYLNIRYQISPQHDYLPETDILVEDYQMLGNGWEGSLGYRHMNFDEGDVDIGRLGIGRYWKNWYGRGVYETIEKGANHSNFYSLILRRYLENSDNYFELSMGTGKEITEVSASNPARTIRTQSFGLEYQFFVNDRTGFDFNFNYVEPDGQATRRSFEVSYLRRW